MVDIENSSFVEDYQGPASFYKLLSFRQNRKPLFLYRNVKRTKSDFNQCPKAVDIKVSGFHPAKSGTLCLLVLSLQQSTSSIDILGRCSRQVTIDETVDWKASIKYSENPIEISSSQQFLGVIFQPFSNGKNSATRASSGSIELSHVMDDRKVIQTLEGLLRSSSSQRYDVSKDSDNNRIIKQDNIMYAAIVELSPLMQLKTLPPLSDFSVEGRKSSKRQQGTTISHIPALSRMKTKTKIQDYQNNRLDQSLRLKCVYPFSTFHQWIILSTGGQRKELELLNKSLPSESDLAMGIELLTPDKNRQGKGFTSSTSSTSSKHSTIAENGVSDVSGVYFHYLFVIPFKDELMSRIEFKDSIVCPWCDFLANRSRNSHSFSPELKKETKEQTIAIENKRNQDASLLMQHLKMSHYHFTYDMVWDPLNSLHVMIRRDRSQNDDGVALLKESSKPYIYWGGSDRQRLFASYIPKLPAAYSTAAKSAALIRDSDHLANSSAFTSGSGNSIKQFQTIRQYYHSRLGLPISSEEIDYDSEADVGMSNEVVLGNLALEEFEDVTMEEKDFMKLWNIHVASFPPYADRYFPFLCELFIARFGDKIALHTLRHNLLLHFMNMWDFGLLRADDLKKLMFQMDQVVKSISPNDAGMTSRNSLKNNSL